MNKKSLDNFIIIVLFIIFSFLTIYQYFYIFSNENIQKNIMKKDTNKKEEKEEKEVKNIEEESVREYILKDYENNNISLSKKRKKLEKNIIKMIIAFPNFDFNTFFIKYKKYDIKYKRDFITFISFSSDWTKGYSDKTIIKRYNEKKNLIFTLDTELNFVNETLDEKERESIILNMNYGKNKMYLLVSGEGYSQDKYFIITKGILLKNNEKNKKKIEIVKNIIKEEKKIKEEEKKILKEISEYYLKNNIVKIKELFKKKKVEYNEYINIYKNELKIKEYYFEKLESLEGKYKRILLLK